MFAQYIVTIGSLYTSRVSGLLESHQSKHDAAAPEQEHIICRQLLRQGAAVDRPHSCRSAGASSLTQPHACEATDRKARMSLENFLVIDVIKPQSATPDRNLSLQCVN